MTRFDSRPPRRALPTIDADASVMDALACMVSHDAPAIEVEDRGRAMGVYGAAQLRQLAGAHGGDPARLSLRQLLKPALAAARPRRAAEARVAAPVAAGAEVGWTTTRWVEA